MAVGEATVSPRLRSLDTGVSFSRGCYLYQYYKKSELLVVVALSTSVSHQFSPTHSCGQTSEAYPMPWSGRTLEDVLP
jgi:hypothetical protein